MGGGLVVLVTTGGNSPLAEMKYSIFIKKAVQSLLSMQQ